MIEVQSKPVRRGGSLRGGAGAAVMLALIVGCNAKSPGTRAQVDATNAPAVAKAAAESQAGAIGAPIVAPPSDASKAIASNEPTRPQTRTAFFRAESAAPKVPTVAFTKREEGLSKVKVGDKLPAISLPKVGGSGSAKLSDSLGKKATVVVLWKSDRRMSLEQLADLGPDVGEAFGKDGVALVGIAVNETAASAAETLKKTEANFPNLLDADGKAFAQIGTERLPRTYLLDPEGKIVWFDIEYSHATRRELHEALRALTGAKQE